MLAYLGCAVAACPVVVGGVAVLWILANSDYLELWMRRLIKKGLKKWTDLDVHDYSELLKLTGEYTVRELMVSEDSWIAEKPLKECRLREEGILVLGINRSDGSYLGAPLGTSKIYPGDVLIIYGRAESIQQLDQRKANAQGEREHKKARDEQKREEEEQARMDADYEAKKKEEIDS